MAKYTPTYDAQNGLPVSAHGRVAPVILHVAVLVVDDEIPLALIGPLFFDLFPFCC